MNHQKGDTTPELEDDGLPPIKCFAEFAKDIPLPTDDDGPIDRCPDCGGELAEPYELEQRRKLCPDYQPHKPCDCDQELPQEWHTYVSDVTQRWGKKNQKVAAIIEEHAKLLNFASDEQLLKFAEKLKIAKEKYTSYDDGSENITVDALQNFDRDNDESSLIGDRWLCKGKQAILQGPTGLGKSSLVMQWAIRLCLGLPFFGIRPIQAMKVLIIQAENDLGDMAEAFQDMIDAMSAAATETGEKYRHKQDSRKPENR